MAKHISLDKSIIDTWRTNNRVTIHLFENLPKELWQQAVALAKEHGLNKTARALNVKYDSLKKHLHEAGADEDSSVKPQPDFIELLPGTMTPSGLECMIEWVNGHNATVRMHIKGVGLSELIALTGMFRSGQA